jgi:hypothetical protein
LRAKVERTAGVDALALLDLAQDPRFATRPASRAHAAQPTRRHRANPAPSIPRHPVLESAGTPTPSALAAATSTADSSGLLLVGLLLVAITAVGIAAKTSRR